MKALRLQSAFKRDLKRIAKRGYDRSKLDAVVDLLRDGEAVSETRRDHLLKGEWQDWRECHIEPDWLLIYQTTDDEVVLARTGTHADLFE